MKRELVIALGLASVLALAACKKQEEATPPEAAPAAEAPVEAAPAAEATPEAAAPAEAPKCPTESDPNAACPETTAPATPSGE